MRERKDNSVYLKHMRDAAMQISEYVAGHSKEEFINSEWDQAAVMHNLEIIGEAASNIDSAYQANSAQIPWRTIIGLRNVLIHDYIDVDLDVVWQIISQDLPVLSLQVDKILTQSDV